MKGRWESNFCKCLFPIYVLPEIKLLFPKENYNVLPPSSNTHVSVKDLCISRIGLPLLLQGNMCMDRSLGMYKSLTDACMWKLGLRPRNSQKKNTYGNVIFLAVWTGSPHCKDKITKFRNKYSQKRNIEVSVPISTFMRLWVIYIFPWSVCLFCWRKYVDRSWDYINRSQTHECRNWGWGRAIPRKGIHKWDFRCSAGLSKGCIYIDRRAEETWKTFQQNIMKEY
jgi:hypothetical protein